MVSVAHTRLLAAMEGWLRAQPAVKAVVLFGSQARAQHAAATADHWSDIDLHVITSQPGRMERVNWAQELPELHFLLQIARPATGGVRKATVLFSEGEVDLVLVPSGKFRLAGWALRCGLHRRIGFLRAALNNLATILGGGYRCLKGERDWGWIYARIATEMPGFRIDDEEARRLADEFLADLLWVLQKLDRGELVAAQRILHRALVETNVVLLHEVRTRDGVPTFQQARRVEQLVTPDELKALQIDARLESAALRTAAWGAFTGLRSLMSRLVPDWRVPAGMQTLLERHRG